MNVKAWLAHTAICLTIFAAMVGVLVLIYAPATVPIGWTAATAFAAFYISSCISDYIDDAGYLHDEWEINNPPRQIDGEFRRLDDAT